jgi:hypothetical protein
MNTHNACHINTENSKYSTTAPLAHSNKEGAILGVVIIVVLGITILLLSLFWSGQHSTREAIYQLKQEQAFWLAEAALEECKAKDDGGAVPSTPSNPSIPGGRYRVEIDKVDASARIAIGSVTYNGQTIERRIRFFPDFNLFRTPFYVGNERSKGTSDYTLHLLGDGASDGPPLPVQGKHIFGGPDIIEGDPEINGNLLMQGQSKIIADANNNFSGDTYTFTAPDVQDQASIAGSRMTFQDSGAPDLQAMNYDTLSNAFNIAAIFDQYGTTTDGRLANKSHPLYDRVRKNPSSRQEEIDSTAGDDYFFEPADVGNNGGTVDTGKTPLGLGDDETYYVEGHVWFHHKNTYGFEVDGQAIIVSTHDIHISDNLQYKDRSDGGDMLALVAMGGLDSNTGELSDHGDIYFGDPRYGTLYTCDAFMFANDDFFYNTDSTTGLQEEPESGFKVFGSFMAVDQIVLLRDWYTDSNRGSYEVKGQRRFAVRKDGKWVDEETGSSVKSTVSPLRRAAKYDPETRKWIDAMTGADLSKEQIKDLRHYAMKAGYDDRIRKAGSYITHLPQGNSTFSHRIKNWQEVAGP